MLNVINQASGYQNLLDQLKLKDNWNKILSNTDFLSGLQEDLGEVEKKLGKQKLAGWIAGENLDEAEKTIINGSNVLDLLKTLDKITDGKTSELFEQGGFGSIEAAIASFSIFGNGSDIFSGCNNNTYNPQTQDDLSTLPVGVRHPQRIPPAAEINGVGNAVVKPIVGNDRKIFSVEILDGGSGYDSSTKITIFDRSGRQAQVQEEEVIVEDGAVKNIVTKQGSGYCGGDNNIDLNVGVGTDISGIITSIYVSAPRIGYTGGDTFTVVGSGVTGFLTITPNGSIIDTTSTNNNLEYDSRPLIVLNTTDGFNWKINTNNEIQCTINH